MHITKIKRFNSRLYFYYINNRINSLTIAVNLNKMPFIIIEGQNYTELPKELWDKIKYMEGREKAISSKSRYLIPFILPC